MAAEFNGGIDVPESAIQIIDENVIGNGPASFYPYLIPFSPDSSHNANNIYHRASAR